MTALRERTASAPGDHAALRPARRPRGPSHATIDVQNLRLRTYIGFNQEERTKQQDVVINLTIEYRIDPEALADVVDSALDYKVITKAVIAHVEGGRFLLLEKLVADVLDICSDHPSVSRARVRIDKPHALRFADSVSLTLAYQDDQLDTNRGTVQ